MLWRCHADSVGPFLSNSFFHFKQFSITAQETGLKVGTDACLLGAFAEHNEPEHCLDIGTGTGVVALFLAQKYRKAETIAIEMEPAVYRQALKNISESPFSERIHPLEGDFLNFQSKLRFDLMVCNPPYFSESLQKQNSPLNRAIHNLGLPVEGLLSQVARLLSESGRFWVIYPPYEAGIMQEKAKAEGLHIHRIVQIFNKPGKHFRTLLCFQKTFIANPEQKDLMMHEADGSRTEAFRLLMSPFYLENTEKYKRQHRES